MSVNVEARTVEPGDDALVEVAWRLKERIRREEGVLKQQRGFFVQAYRGAEVFYYADAHTDELIGFAAVRRDGYLLFLAVSPDWRGEGFGEQLVARVADGYSRVTCHARTTNQNALDFYDHLGFEFVRRVNNYYEDGGDAYYLRLGEGSGLVERLSSILGR